MAEEILIIRKPTAPTLIAIITMKLFKGTFFVLLALAFYTLSDNNLQWEYSYLLKYFHIDQGRKVFIDFGQRLGNFSETDMLWVAGLTLIYGSFSLIEGIGLLMRYSWASWVAIAESALLIPLELGELGRHKHFHLTVFIIFVFNVIIVVYLLLNRRRLFGHHHPD
jgi:uncharacterized membrane protein (DUF2068 family)